MSLDHLLAVNIEPVICYGHLPYPQGQGLRVGRVELDTRGREQNATEREGSVNIEPTICNGHLPYPWQ